MKHQIMLKWFYPPRPSLHCPQQSKLTGERMSELVCCKLLYIACILLWNLSEGTVRVRYEGTKWANFKQSVHNFHDNVWALSRKVAHKVELYCEPLVIFIWCSFSERFVLLP